MAGVYDPVVAPYNPAMAAGTSFAPVYDPTTGQTITNFQTSITPSGTPTTGSGGFPTQAQIDQSLAYDYTSPAGTSGLSYTGGAASTTTSGNSAATTAPAASGAAASACGTGYNPANWFCYLGQFAGNVAARVSLFILALILIAGGIAIYAVRTANDG